MENSKIKKILLVSLSNIGDVILTFPVFDLIREQFPNAELSVVIGPRAESLLKGNPVIQKLYIFEKRQTLGKTIGWVGALKKEKFDLVVDLRNTAIPFFLRPPFSTPLSKTKMEGGQSPHMKERHLARLKTVVSFSGESKHRYALYIGNEDKKSVELLIRESGISDNHFIVIGPGAANHTKRWTTSGFAALSDALIEKQKKEVIFVGDKSDAEVAGEIARLMKNKAHNWCGKTTLTQLAEIMRRASLVVANDSAIMHMASYLDIPTLAIFGPTDPSKYGPWSSKSSVIKRDLFCSPCEKSGCAYNHECMEYISPQMIIKEILTIVGEVSLKIKL